MARTAFQVVELAIDANDQVIDRKAIPYPYPTHKDAVDTIESLATKFAEFGYETDGDFWWVWPPMERARSGSSLSLSEAKYAQPTLSSAKPVTKGNSKPHPSAAKH